MQREGAWLGRDEAMHSTRCKEYRLMAVQFSRRKLGAFFGVTFLLIGGCRLADGTSPSSLGGGRPNRKASTQDLTAVASAGCTFGMPEGDNSSRVITVSRDRLPFRVPVFVPSADT